MGGVPGLTLMLDAFLLQVLNGMGISLLRFWAFTYPLCTIPSIFPPFPSGKSLPRAFPIAHMT